MPGKRSAGILLFRRNPGLEVLIGHMGGPFWSRRDDAAWSIPKGEYGPEEDPWAAARREFTEELGAPPPDGPVIDLGSIRQSGGKVVTVWALEGDFDPASAVFGTFEMEWPRGSGRVQEFPEIDRVGWFDVAMAQEKLVKGQREVLARLTDALSEQPPSD
jgi:predicted NUDIX family NTP pyrophosphohydrolase